MIKRWDIVASTTIAQLQAAVQGTEYEDLLNDLNSITVDAPNFNTIQTEILTSFDKEQGEYVQEAPVIVSGGSYTLTGVTSNQITGMSIVVPNPWPELVPVGTVDPTNVSTNDANLINGNLTDLCYNNSSNGSANKPLPGIDLGSPQAVARIDLYRWSATYLSNNFSIQGSNDGTTWTDVATNLQSTQVWLQELPVSGTYRYWRLFNISGTNATFVVLSEMKAFAVWVGSTTFSAQNNPDVVIEDDPSGNTIIRNNLSQDLTFIINYLV